MLFRTVLFTTALYFSFLQNGHAQSPYTLKWPTEAYHVALGGITLGTGLIISSSINGLTEEELALLDRNSINSFDRGATYNSSSSARTASDILVSGSFLLPLTLLAPKDTRKDFGKIAALYGETTLVIVGLTYLTKVVVLRTRPYAYNEDFSLATKKSLGAHFAFFSGHASFTAANCFFTAKVFSDYFPDSKLKPYVWAGAIIIPAATGYFRVAAGRHFPTDVIAGYIVGASVGILVPHFHRNRNTSTQDSGLTFNVGATGAIMNWRF